MLKNPLASCLSVIMSGNPWPMELVSDWGIVGSLAVTAEENQIVANIAHHLSRVQKQGTSSNRVLL